MPKLECLSPEAINNRFVNATSQYADAFFKNAIKDDPWLKLMRQQRIADIMKKHGCSEAKAKKIYNAEHKKWLKEYNSPLKVAERKIVELENRLEDIKRFITDPDSFDCP